MKHVTFLLRIFKHFKQADLQAFSFALSSPGVSFFVVFSRVLIESLFQNSFRTLEKHLGMNDTSQAYWYYIVRCVHCAYPVKCRQKSQFSEHTNMKWIRAMWKITLNQIAHRAKSMLKSTFLQCNVSYAFQKTSQKSTQSQAHVAQLYLSWEYIYILKFKFTGMSSSGVRYLSKHTLK